MDKKCESAILYSFHQLSKMQPKEEPLNLREQPVEELKEVKKKIGNIKFQVGDEKVPKSVSSTSNYAVNKCVPPLAIPFSKNSNIVPTLLIASSKRRNNLPPLLFYPKNEISKEGHQGQLIRPTTSAAAILLVSEPEEPKNLLPKSLPNTPLNLSTQVGNAKSPRPIFNPRDIELPFFKKKKTSRPFLLYPDDPLKLTAKLRLPKCVKNFNSNQVYYKYRNEMLSSVQYRKMKKQDATIGDSGTTDDVKIKRMRHNMASKRFRDKRRVKEDEIATRAAFLEIENIKLRYHILGFKHALKKEKLSKFNKL